MKKFLSMCLVFVLVLGLVGTIASADNGKIRVGLMPSAVGAPVQLAKEKGYFDEEGLEIEMVIFPNGAAINEAMAAGELDLACSGAATVFALANGNAVLLGDVEASGGMGIWVKPDSDILTVKGQIEKYPEMYGSAETIKGKSFVCSLGTASQFNVLRYIEQYGLTDSDIEIVNMDWSPAVQAFTIDEVDCIATFSPYSFQAMEAGGQLICTFEDATETALYDMLFSDRTFLEKNRDDIVKFVRAFYKAVDDLANDEEMRSTWSREWFASEGRVYDEATMAQEIIDRPYCSTAVMKEDNYILGEAMYSYAAFNVSIEKIEDWQLDYMKDCYDSSVISEALGFEIAQPQF